MKLLPQVSKLVERAQSLSADPDFISAITELRQRKGVSPEPFPRGGREPNSEYPLYYSPNLLPSKDDINQATAREETAQDKFGLYYRLRWPAKERQWFRSLKRLADRFFPSAVYGTTTDDAMRSHPAYLFVSAAVLFTEDSYDKDQIQDWVLRGLRGHGLGLHMYWQHDLQFQHTDQYTTFLEGKLRSLGIDPHEEAERAGLGEHLRELTIKEYEAHRCFLEITPLMVLRDVTEGWEAIERAKENIIAQRQKAGLMLPPARQRSQNRDRNAAIYAKAIDTTSYPYWEDVQQAVSQDFPEVLHMTLEAIASAARRYQENNRLPQIPKRKSGPKPL